MKYFSIILFSILSYFSFAQPCDTIKEKEVLIDFYKSLNGKNWANNENWASKRPVSTWFGITTNSKGCVTKIEFTRQTEFRMKLTVSNNLAGQIPATIGQLSYLKILNLRFNNITGNIPKEIGKLKQLYKLDLSYNQIEGEIPKELFDIPYLAELNLSNNHIDGEIPKEIENLKYLETLNLSMNELRKIPKEIWKLESIKTINISGNNLSGNLPNEIGNLKNLVTLNLSKNNLSGQIPSELMQIKKLRYLSLENNLFMGVIPESFYTHKTIINLQHNQLSGCIAEENKHYFNKKITTRNNPKLPYEGFSYKIKRAKSLKNTPCNDGNPNTLNDKINDNCECTGFQTKLLTPQEIDSITLLTFFRESYGEKWKNKTNWLSQNPLSTWYGIKVNVNNRVIEINLNNNKLLGTLTKEISNLTELQVLNLAENSIWKKIPEEISQLKHLRILSLNDNHFADCIPQGIVTNYCKLSKKKKENFNLSNNPGLPFAGDLDEICKQKSQIGAPCTVNNINYAYSEIDENCECKGYKYSTLNCRKRDSTVLMALYNSTNGENWIHNDNWGTKRPLRDWYGINSYANCVLEINLNSNNLSGYIPKEIENLKNLNSIDLSNSQLKSIPEEITKLEHLEYLTINNAHLIGSIPKFIGNLKNLRSLSLKQNNLGGSIPKSIGNLKKLIWLHLEDNQLSNEIPKELGKLKCDTYLQNNDFSGCINQSIFSLMKKSVNDDMLHNNPKLAYSGYFELLESTKYLRSPCYDDDPNTYNDKINRKCKCQGKKIPKRTKPRLKDSLALISFFNATNGNNWTNNQNWKTKAPLSSWYGIKSNTAGRITEIELINNNLKGIIPSDINLLTELKVLNLKGNRLVLFPKELFELLNLEILNLNLNRFSIKIPTEIGNLSNLISLDLGNNTLTGTLPKSLRKLTKLTSLILNANYFQGDLPKEVYNLSSLKLLVFDKRKQNIAQPLIKSIRENICQEDSITLITIFNALRIFEYEKGCILTSSGKNKITLDSNGYITDLNLSYNKYSGFIPKEIGDLKELTKLSLYQNSIHGEIPKEIGQLKKLKILNLSNNYFLEGSIPKEIGALINLEELNLNNNKIKGKIPNEICQLKNLKQLDLSNNLLTSIPNDIGNLKQLTILNLRRNQISQKLPKSIGNLTNIQNINLSKNNFSGSIDINFEHLKKLNQLILSDNKLEGGIPKSIGHLKWLFRLNLENNFINQPIPKEIGNLDRLRSLMLANNKIQGRIPKEIGNLDRLDQLTLNDNYLEGPIPEELGKLKNIRMFYLQNNNISGCIPKEIITLLSKLKFNLHSSLNLRNGYNFNNNPAMPFKGMIEKFSTNINQIGSPCDDENQNTKNDKIQENCECKGD